MKVMLVRPKPDRKSLGLTDLMHCEPLDMEYVGTLVKSLNHDVLLVDLQVDRRSIKYYLKKYNPDVVLFTSYLLEFTIGSWPWQTYADYAINFQGRIALSPSIRFGIGGVIFLYLIQPLLDILTKKLGDKKTNIISIILLIIILIDCMYTFIIR